MSLVDLAIVYGLLGVGCAVAVVRRGGAGPGSIALALLLWPLWAPIALLGRSEGSGDASADASATRIATALREGVIAAAGTPFATLLPRDAAERIVREVERTSLRLCELEQLVAQESLDLGAAERRLEALDAIGAGERAQRTAELHLENVRRLHALIARDRRALAELEELAIALRTQLLLSRYAEPAAEGVSAMVSEVWARVEGLGAAIDAA